jgi:hypothetical protein
MQCTRLPTLSRNVFEIAAHQRDLDARFDRRREQRRRAAARNAHASHARRIELRPAADVIDRPDDVPHAPADERLPEHQRAARDRIAGLLREPFPRVDRIAPAPEAHRLDRNGCEAGFGNLNREIVLIP